MTGCEVDYPHARINRQRNSTSKFILNCTDNVTTAEITCKDGNWTEGLHPSQCPGPPSPIDSTTVSGKEFSVSKWITLVVTDFFTLK